MDPPLADLRARVPGQVDSKQHPRHFDIVVTKLDHKIIILLSSRLHLFQKIVLHPSEYQHLLRKTSGIILHVYSNCGVCVKVCACA